jgi:DNA-binding XRE family transcriptional regulator
MIAAPRGAQLGVAQHCPLELVVQPHGQDMLTGAVVPNFTLLKIRTVAARFRHDVEAARMALRGNAVPRLTVRREAGLPLTSIGGNLNGLDGPWIVGADGDAHRAAFSKCTLVCSRNQYDFRTSSGQLVRCGDALATIRKRHLLSQRALAQKAGVALSTIYLLEAGRTERVTFKVMRSVSAALGVPPQSIAEFRRAMGLDLAGQA